VERGVEAGHEEVREDGGEPRPGAEDDEVRVGDGGDGLRAGGRIGGVEPDLQHLSPRRGDSALAADRDDLVPDAHVRADLQGNHRHGEHRAPGAEETAHEVETGHRITQLLPDRGDEQVTHRVLVERP